MHESKHGFFKIAITIVIIIIIVSIIAYSIWIGSSDKKVYLKGSGASFPYPLIQTLINKYKNINPSVRIDYASVGSGAGQADLLNMVVDFAGSDAPLTDEQLSSAPGWILHIPYTLGAVVIAYNIPGSSEDLKLTPELIVLIFGGKISRWNDERLVEYNPWLNDINKSITVIHRSDASGTTWIFTTFLSRETSFWREHFGAGKTIAWPNLDRFIGGKGNEGVTGLIKQTPYSIGYVEFTYAYKEGIAMASVRNRVGIFIKPSVDSISKAAAVNISNLDPRDLRISRFVIDSNVSDAYPISSCTYFLVYEDWSVYDGQPNVIKYKAKAFKEWVIWILNEGVKYYKELGYAPIPSSLKSKVIEALNLTSYKGSRL